MLTNIVKKVPGESPINPKEKQGYLQDLSTLTKIALLEIQERESKVLSNRTFLSKLPDKGERIRKFLERVENELRRRDDISDMCEVMQGLKLNGKELADTLEWKHKSEPFKEHTEKPRDDEVVDEANALKILATHSGAGFHSKKYRVEKEPEPLINDSDLKDIRCFKAEEYAASLCEKLDNVEAKERFLPFKTLVRSKEPKAEKIRDITAATPPLPKFGDTRLVSLEESIKLQAEQAMNLRKVQLAHAVERLRAKGPVMGATLPPLEAISHYRETQPSESEEEIFDDDAKDEPGGVIFPVPD